MGNKFPLDTLLNCLLAHWEGYQLEGLKNKKIKKLIKYLNTSLLTPWKEGKNGPSWGQLDSTPSYSSVNTENTRVNNKEVPYVQAFIALYQDSKKERKYKLEEFDKCSFKVLLARSEAEDPLDLLLTSLAQAEGHRKRKFRQAQKSGG